MTGTSTQDDAWTLWKLEIFTRVVQERSFSSAARVLGLSQPTVSSHIAALEQAIGARLFDRVEGSIALTRVGEVLATEARKILAAHQHARDVVSDFLGVKKGDLRLGGSTIPSTYVLPTYLRRFRDRHPGIRIRLAASNSGNILSALQEGELEVGVIGEKPGSERFRSFPFETDELVLAVPASHALAGASSIPLEELERHDHVLREPGSGSRARAERVLEKRGFDLPRRAPVACEVGSSEGVRQAVLAGLGVGFLSIKAIEEDLAAARLVSLSIDGVDLTRRFHVVTSVARSLSPIGRAFLQFLKEEGPKRVAGRRS